MSKSSEDSKCSFIQISSLKMPFGNSQLRVCFSSQANIPTLLLYFPRLGARFSDNDLCKVFREQYFQSDVCLKCSYFSFLFLSVN